MYRRRFLLCSDGLYQELTGNDLGNALDLGAPHDALEHLFECVLRGDARDNLTAVIVRQ